MADITIDFAGPVRAYVATHGITVDDDKIERTAAILQSTAKITGVRLDGFDMGPGGVIDLATVLDVEFAGAARRSISAVKTKAPSTHTERSVATNLAAREAAKSSAAADGNPWLAATYSRTNQALLTNRNPELAAALRVAPGALA